MNMERFGVTNTGMCRELNEDSYYIHYEHPPFFVLADGMGGHNAGETASAIAVECIRRFIKLNAAVINDETAGKLISGAVRQANTTIYEAALRTPALSGMGTTVDLCMLDGNNSLYVGHVGDSRVYVLRAGEMEQITNDHSMVARLVENGTITAEEAKTHPQRNVITRAVGTDATISVDLKRFDLMANDIILMCSDGLTGMLEDDEISMIIYREPSMADAADALVNQANRLGGLDNITVVLFKMNEHTNKNAALDQ